VYAGSIPTPASISFPSIAEPLDCLRHCDEARVAELVDATDLKSVGGQPPCRFESGPGHHLHCGRK
jgi:hypothetical protein